MTTVIAGSRPPKGISPANYAIWKRRAHAELTAAIRDSGYAISAVVCGKARGMDDVGEEWAKANGLAVVPKPADWTKYGKAAGAIRNGEMADIADAAIVVMRRDGSPGSQNMIEQMQKRGKPCFVRLVASDTISDNNGRNRGFGRK